MQGSSRTGCITTPYPVPHSQSKNQLHLSGNV